MKRAREAGDRPKLASTVARFTGSETYFYITTWGLRPRLYSVARFAGC